MDVFLQPLIDKLNELWVTDIDTRDVVSDDSVFKMWTALLWMVNDFLIRSSLFKCSGLSYKECSTCN